MAESKGKALLLRREDLINAILEAINGSNLPPVIVEPILAEFHRQAKEALQKQYDAEAEQYEADRAGEALPKRGDDA